MLKVQASARRVTQTTQRGAQILRSHCAGRRDQLTTGLLCFKFGLSLEDGRRWGRRAGAVGCGAGAGVAVVVVVVAVAVAAAVVVLVAVIVAIR